MALAAAAGVAVGHARAYHQAREHELWLETAAAASSWLTGGLPRDEALAAVLARVGRAPRAATSTLFGETDELPTALAEELAGVWPVLRELEDGTWALALPLRSGDRWVGALAAYWPAGEAPQLDLPSIAGFGEQLALALDVADAAGGPGTAGRPRGP